MPSIEEEVLPVNLNDRARADPAVLAAAAGGLQHRFVILRVREEVRGRDEIGRVVVGIAGLFQVVDVVDAVLIVGHGVAHEGLAGPVHLREEEEIIVIGILLASRRAQARKVLVVSRLLDRVSRVLVPGSVERQVAFDFVRVGPGFGQILVLVPALEDIALADRRGLLDRLGGGRADLGRVPAGIVFVQSDGIALSAGRKKRGEQAQRQQYRKRSGFLHMCVPPFREIMRVPRSPRPEASVLPARRAGLVRAEKKSCKKRLIRPRLRRARPHPRSGRAP